MGNGARSDTPALTPIKLRRATAADISEIAALERVCYGDPWPPSAFALCVFNDVIWWIPFGLYLRDAWVTDRASA